MMRRRSSVEYWDQAAISASERPQPTHSFDIGSTVQTLMQGLSMMAMASVTASIRRKLKDRDSEGNRASRLAGAKLPSRIGRVSRPKYADRNEAADHIPMLCRNRRRRSDPAVLLKLGAGSAGSGATGGLGSASGASADITRSGGNVTTTSVPMRNFDLSAKVPP